LSPLGCASLRAPSALGGAPRAMFFEASVAVLVALALQDASSKSLSLT